MYGEKNTLQSKTIIACLVNMGILIAGWFNFDLDEKLITEFFMALFSFITICIAIWGRIIADKQIK